jgi:hypothetical protein
MNKVAEYFDTIRVKQKKIKIEILNIKRPIVNCIMLAFNEVLLKLDFEQEKD